MMKKIRYGDGLSIHRNKIMYTNKVTRMQFNQNERLQKHKEYI